MRTVRSALPARRLASSWPDSGTPAARGARPCSWPNHSCIRAKLVIGRLSELIARNRAGSGEAVPAVCSTQPEALAASLLLAREEGALLLVEATSNQVNQFGGYTGMAPADFRRRLEESACRLGVDRQQLVLGGDHLGPQVWRRESATAAMRAARDMVRAYVQAGFRKIHLD